MRNDHSRNELNKPNSDKPELKLNQTTKITRKQRQKLNK
jgi:hypothetical protein